MRTRERNIPQVYPRPARLMRRSGKRRRAPADLYARVKAQIPVGEAVTVFTGEVPDRNGFCRCPFGTHADADKSFKVYPDTQSFFCFGCGKGGDVIDFAMEFLHVGHREAAQALNEKFGLGILPGQAQTADCAAALEAARRKRAERERQEAVLDAAALEVRNARKALDALPKPRALEEGGARGAAMARLKRGEEQYQLLLNGKRRKKQTFPPSI